MADLDPAHIKSMDALLETAATHGIDKALEDHGEAINAREAAALRKLSPAEFQQLNGINKKIDSALGPRGGTQAWGCGFIC
jgi:hypothetical protein